MALSNQDRDELLVDIFEGLAHITAQLEFQNKLSSKVMRDKVAYYKDKLLDRDEEVKTRVGNGMYDTGDYVFITLPPPPPKRKSSIPPPPILTDKGLEEIKKEAALWAKESKEKTRAIEDITLEDLETLVK